MATCEATQITEKRVESGFFPSNSKDLFSFFSNEGWCWCHQYVLKCNVESGFQKVQKSKETKKSRKAK